MPQPEVEFVRYDASVDVVELTALLHRAYAPLLAAGWNYTACTQPPEETRSRCESGETWLAKRGGRIVGTITVHPPGDDPEHEYYGRPGVAFFEQFGVDPDLQGLGIGRALLDLAETFARNSGARELACDTAEPAAHLIALYQRWGYPVSGHCVYHGKTYRSVVMAKKLLCQELRRAQKIC